MGCVNYSLNMEAMFLTSPLGICVMLTHPINQCYFIIILLVISMQEKSLLVLQYHQAIVKGQMLSSLCSGGPVVYERLEGKGLISPPTDR